MNDPHLLLAAIALADRSGRAHLRLLALPRYARLVSANCGVERKLKERFTRMYHISRKSSILVTEKGLGFKLPNGCFHRTHRDPKTGHTLPAILLENYCLEWIVNGVFHREDKDESGYTLPAIIRAVNGEREWRWRGVRHRLDFDRDGLLLPAFVNYRRAEWWVYGKKLPPIPHYHAHDNVKREGGLPSCTLRDEHGRLLPALGSTRGEWWIGGIKVFPCSGGSRGDEGRLRRGGFGSEHILKRSDAALISRARSIFQLKDDDLWYTLQTRDWSVPRALETWPRVRCPQGVGIPLERIHEEPRYSRALIKIAANGGRVY